MTIRQQAQQLVQKMTNEEKAFLLTGKDFWHLNGVQKLHLPEIMVTDGPHGLRRQTGSADHVGLNQSAPATCFPTESALACSFDTELLYQIGTALGGECVKEQVAVLLGPAVNHKRSPLCGRNFEYFSEDPVLTGKLGAAYVKGVQSKGIGTSVKHFAANNQEKQRLVADSIVDERSLHEIYLKQFEIIVKESNPATIMTAYNRVNGVYASENSYLMTEIARKRWEYQGLFVSDWGAVNDPVESFLAGLDLEMPGLCKGADKLVLAALEQGRFPQERLDEIAKRLVALILKSQETLQKGTKEAEGPDRHVETARRALEESAVLLKNDRNILPLSVPKPEETKTERPVFTVIGELSHHPRYQGAGSSKVNPYGLTGFLDALVNEGWEYRFAKGYLEDGTTTDALIQEAATIAAEAPFVIVFTGLPANMESESRDRTTLDLPEGHNRLIEALCAVNQNIIVVLQCGSPVVMPWREKAAAILHSHLGGSQCGPAVYRILTGAVNPSGRLAETYPLSLSDTPCGAFYHKTGKICAYQEHIFTGYRYYESAEVPVQYPFGYGLSYTTFAYDNLNVTTHKDQTITVSVDVTNTGKYSGKDVVQLYTAVLDSAVIRPVRELKAFQKVSLEAGQTKTVSLSLRWTDLAYYDTTVHDWKIEDGTYRFMICRNSSEVCLWQDMSYPAGTTEAARQENTIRRERLDFSREHFEKLLGRSVPQEPPVSKPYTHNITLGDLAGKSWFYRLVSKIARIYIAKSSMDEAAKQQARINLMDMPVRSFGMSGFFDRTGLEGIIKIMNGHLFSGLRMLRKKTGEKNEK